jgi:hypothetical protein
MSGALTILASLVMASNSPQGLREVEDESMRFANVLINSYNCEVLGYKVDYVGLADWGFVIRDRFVAAGLEPEAAMGRIQADIRVVRRRYNSANASPLLWIDYSPVTDIIIGGRGMGDFIHLFTERCDALAEQEHTAAFFEKPEKRLSVGDLYKKLSDMRRAVARRP